MINIINILLSILARWFDFLIGRAPGYFKSWTYDGTGITEE